MILDAIQPEIAELRASITRHFPVEPLPERDDIIGHQCEECWALRDDFASKRWMDIPREIIDSHFDNLPLFTPSAHHYYLPAYLLRSLDSEGQSWGTVVDFVIYALCPENPEWWSSRFSVLTPEQLRVVATWLEFVLSHQTEFEGDEVVGQKGFNKYWKNYVAYPPN